MSVGFGPLPTRQAPWMWSQSRSSPSRIWPAPTPSRAAKGPHRRGVIHTCTRPAAVADAAEPGLFGDAVVAPLREPHDRDGNEILPGGLLLGVTPGKPLRSIAIVGS